MHMFFDQMHGKVKVEESKRFLVKLHSSTKHLSTCIHPLKNKQSTRTAYSKRHHGIFRICGVLFERCGILLVLVLAAK